MIIYLDTSALVKLYIEETASDIVFKATAQADAVATHTISFVEACAAFARRQREKKLTTQQLSSLKTNLTQEWETYSHIEVTPTIIQQAANFSEAFALRAYDSVHLAAAHLLYKEGKLPVMFACFDHKLNRAAEALGLALLPIK